MDAFRLEIQGLFEKNALTIANKLNEYHVDQTNNLKQLYQTNVRDNIAEVKREIKNVGKEVTRCEGNVNSHHYDINTLFDRVGRTERNLENLVNNNNIPNNNINNQVVVLNNRVNELNNKVDELNDVVQGLENNETAPRIKKRSILGRVYNYIRSWFWSDTVETIIIPDNAQDINNNNNQAVDQRSMLRKIRDFFFYNPFRN